MAFFRGANRKVRAAFYFITLHLWGTPFRLRHTQKRILSPQSEQVFPKAGFYKFLLYDSKRQRLYLSGIDHVDVFDLGSNQFLAPIQPPRGSPPNAGLRGLAMTPDSSHLVVADFGAQSFYLIDPDTSSGSSSFVGGIPGYANSGPSRVAATSAQTVFVGMSAEGGTQSGCSACLVQMDISAFPPTVTPATQSEIFFDRSPLLQADSSGNRRLYRKLSGRQAF